jgi:hypothetical protein
MSGQSQRKIKNYSDFSMQNPSYYKLLNKLVISGEYKPGFLYKKRKFEMTFFYSPVKGIIIHLIPTDIDEDFYPFRRGSNISEVLDWVKSNGHKIEVDHKKF